MRTLADLFSFLHTNACGDPESYARPLGRASVDNFGGDMVSFLVRTPDARGPMPAQQPSGVAKRARRTAADTSLPASSALRTAILNGEYSPGERLVEATLCERVGASRFVIRAALQDPAAEGLVEVQRNKGAHVRKVSLAEAVEITQVRMVLEGLVAAEAARRVTDDQAIELDEVGVLMR